MELSSLIIAILVIIVIFLILHFVMKTLKLMVAITIIVIVLGIWFYGFSGTFDKMKDVKNGIPELGIKKIATSITGCTMDQECIYVTDSAGCTIAEGYCANIIKEENYIKADNETEEVIEEEITEEEIVEGETEEITEQEKCNRSNVQFDFKIECECKLHKERDGDIKQWLGDKIEEKAGYTYCWKKSE